MAMALNVLTNDDVARRAYWISEIKKLSGHFGNDSERLNQELRAEIGRDGVAPLLSHIRLCGAIPETFGHDSSEEKLYSKYTDSVLCHAFIKVGLTSVVLQERADSADVECVATDYSFVADAKAFRLSRTAKNQKDFKVQAMDNWKRGKPYAVVVCPVYQLPTRASQIYQQAIARNVCVFTYSHLSVLTQLSESVGPKASVLALRNILSSLASLNPSKDATAYWQVINRTLMQTHAKIPDIWQKEKLAALDSITIAKEEALTAIAVERERIMRMSHEIALKELIDRNNLDGREEVIRAVTDTGILAIT